MIKDSQSIELNKESKAGVRRQEEDYPMSA